MIPPESSSQNSSEDYAIDWARRTNAVGDILIEIARKDARTRRRWLAFACGAATSLLVGIFIVRSDRRARIGHVFASATTVVSLPARQVLPDGSIVELKDGASISIAFRAHSLGARRVNLDHGEAHFTVTKNKKRPFIVAAGGIEVRAVGTEFLVDRDRTQVEVIVNEGRVTVDEQTGKVPVHGPSAAPEGLTTSAQTVATVDAGNRIVVKVPNGTASRLALLPVQSLTPSTMEERMAWRQPKFEFSRTPLVEAVAIFNQHNEIKLVLADPDLGHLQVSGFLSANKIETFVLLLEMDFGIIAEHRAHEIILSRP